MKKILFLIFQLSILGCKSQKTTEQELPSPTTFANEVSPTDDCYFPRKTIRSLDSEPGTIALVANDYIILAEKGRRYLPCEIPLSFQQEGLAVIFSGDKLEMMNNERWKATPMRLKTMSIDTSR